MFLRSLLVQASWSFERLQAPGFFLTILPALGGRPPAPRHLGLFNTHPYFAGLVAATVAREDAGGGEGEALAEGLKRSLMCALGGIGDDFFWAHLRPAAALAALPLGLAGSPWAVALFLAVYNLPHLAVRAGGIALGLSRGRGVVSLLQAPALARAVPALARALTLLAGVVLGLVAVAPGARTLAGGGGTAAAAALAVFAAVLALEARGVRPGALLGAAAALALIAGLAGEVGGP